MRCAQCDRPMREGPDDRSSPLAPVAAELLKPVGSLQSACVYSSFPSNFCDFSIVALTPPRHTQLNSLLGSLRSLLVHHPLSFRPAIAKLGSRRLPRSCAIASPLVADRTHSYRELRLDTNKLLQQLSSPLSQT